VTAPFRCAAESAARGDPLAGTASTVRAFLLVENPGPWGVDALRDSRLPEPVRAGLATRARAAGVRVLLVRRHHRRAPREGFTVFAAYADPARPWAERVVLDRAEDLLELDLASLGAGRSPGLPPHGGSLLCACTHGRHDACCAERGRPVAAALAGAHAEQAWECSHIGGDRFAGNLLVLPHGLYYGRLEPEQALAVADAHLDGHLVLEHLRGRSGWPMPVQAAEIGLRRELTETRLDAVSLLGVERTGSLTVARLAVAGSTYDVEVRTVRGPAEHVLTCRAGRAATAPGHQVVAVREVRR
jgi:hypothetical protein